MDLPRRQRAVEEPQYPVRWTNFSRRGYGYGGCRQNRVSTRTILGLREGLRPFAAVCDHLGSQSRRGTGAISDAIFCLMSRLRLSNTLKSSDLRYPFAGHLVPYNRIKLPFSTNSLTFNSPSSYHLHAKLGAGIFAILTSGRSVALQPGQRRLESSVIKLWGKASAMFGY